MRRYAAVMDIERRTGLMTKAAVNTNTLTKKTRDSDLNSEELRSLSLFLVLAERVGFEPTVRVNRTPDFESGPFDHSGTSPVGAVILVSIRPDVKYAFGPSNAIIAAGCDTEYRACACC